jgi:hypothetical protein
VCENYEIFDLYRREIEVPWGVVVKKRKKRGLFFICTKQLKGKKTKL